MKKIRFLALLLLLPLLLSSCSAQKTPESTTQTEEDIMPNRLRREEVDAFPLVSQNLSMEKRRALCVDFFAYSQSFLWTPSEDFTDQVDGKEILLKKDEIYQGLPYVEGGFGNLYRALDHYEEKTGQIQLSSLSSAAFGTSCIQGAYWAWGRLINSARFSEISEMVAQNGFLPVGPYEYDENLSDFGQTGTDAICRENGEQVMYQSYAAILEADGLVSCTTAQHVKMCGKKPTVATLADGSIDGENSYLLLLHQGETWLDTKTEKGLPLHIQNEPFTKVSFREAFEEGYLPFTFAELCGDSNLDVGILTFSGSDPLTLTRLRDGLLTSNYGISDIYLTLSSKQGKVVKETVLPCDKIDQRSMVLGASAPTLIRPYVKEEMNLVIRCRLSTGEIKEAYSGPVFPDR